MISVALWLIVQQGQKQHGSRVTKYDAVVVGSGPNGLSAAITLAEKGQSVLLIEAKKTIGGGMRSAELTIPGFVHDVCSTIHPLALASPFFNKLDLKVKWIEPPVPLAHPFLNQNTAFLKRSIEETVTGQDARAYQKLMKPFVNQWKGLISDILAPLHFPRHPIAMARFGFYGLPSAEWLARLLFKEEATRSLFAGLAAHANLPLNKLVTSAFGLVLGFLGHGVGWPLVEGGTQNLANALLDHFKNLGGEVATDMPIDHFQQLPPAKTVLFDVSPKTLLNIMGDQFPSGYRKRLERFNYGPGVFKIDWALSSPIPWKDPLCSQAGTVHLGGTLNEIAASEREVSEGKIPKKNFIIVTQPTLFDPTRAPKEKQIAWAYCHVPNGSTVDMTSQIEGQIEEMAPGFKDCILAKHTFSPAQLEQYNANYVGGDINGGMEDIFQLFTRPVARLDPYSTPVKGVYLCSSSTPPGGGVHGMCGYHAALSSSGR